MSEDFSLFTQEQRKSYCGPCSMAYCLYLLGSDTDQDEVARKTELAWWRRRGGFDEKALQRAANNFGASAEYVLMTDKKSGHRFAEKLRKHLKRGLPAVLLVNTYGPGGHWTALLGYAEETGSFIFVDPNDHEPIFSRWSEKTLLGESWNVFKPSRFHSEPDQYCAILLRRKDGKPARWTITREFVSLCGRGSNDLLSNMTSDLMEIAKNATLGKKLSGKGRPFSEILDEYEDVVVDNAWAWTGVENDVTKVDVRQQYRDYRVIADAAGLKLPAGADHTAFVAQMTAILCAYIWNDGELS